MKSTLIRAAVVASLFTLASQASAADGRAVYNATCSVCHATGAAGAPRPGDKASWAPRLTNIAALKISAIKGKGVMPAKGGNSSLSVADVYAAVDYMIAQSR
ncbi:c-type cytochrome [Noviherbaspirillum agri]